MYEASSDIRLPSLLKEQADRVADVVRLIVSELEEFSCNHKGAKDAGLTFRPRDCSRWVADVRTPISDGRFILGWRIHKSELQGVLSVQRKEFDQFDRQEWREVWALIVPPYEQPYVGTGANEFSIPVDEDDRFSDMKREIGKFGMRVLEAIVAGPIKKTSQQ